MTQLDLHDAVRRRGPRQRLFVTLGVAAAVLAIAVPAALHAAHHTSTPPAGATPAPVGAAPTVSSGPPTVPYIVDHVLHAGGRAIPTTATGVYAAGDAVVVDTYAHASNTWQVLRGGRLVNLPVTDPAQVVLDDTGDFVAALWWPDKQHARIEAWDPATGASTGSITLPVPWVECCGGGQDVMLYGAHGDAVFYEAATAHGFATWRWTPAAEPVRVTVPKPLMSVTPLGLVLQDDGAGVGKAPAGLVGETDATGTWARKASMGTDQQFAASADGTRLAYVPYEKAPGPTPDLVVENLAQKTRRTVTLPTTKGYVEPVAFEDDATLLLLEHRGDRSLLMRCSIATAQCARSLTLSTPTAELPIAGFRG